MFFYSGKFIKTVGFVGLGKSNKGVLSYLREHYKGLEFTLRCSAYEGISNEGFKSCYFGNDVFKNITEDLLFLSPSVRRDAPELIRAANMGVILSSDAEFFFSNVTSDVYAVTGSDGKSTTTYLTSCLLSDSYEQAFPSGNIGEAMTPHLDDQKTAAHVTELSSFQLSYMKPKTKRAVITNVTENHLNWHKSFDEYIDAKKNLLFRAEEPIVNYDCPITRRISQDFDIFAAFSKNLDERTLKKKIRAKLYVTLSDGIITASGEPMLNAKSIKVAGAHNLLNFMAAIAMSFGKCSKESILTLAESFGGLRHRCELIHESAGVKYYDSSIDSSPKRCAATLDGFYTRTTLILGGKSKGLDFKELLPTLKKKAKRIILTGECAEEIFLLIDSDKDFSRLGIPYCIKADFEEAVRYAIATATRGDSVILSPAATSYDKFKNFEERGDFFAKLVKDYKK